MLLLDGEKPLMALCQSTQRSALPVFAQIVAETPEGADKAEQSNALDLQWRALAYSSQAVDSSTQVCSCFEVSQSQIHQSLAAGVTTIEGLGSALKCGTNCGSCVPELKRLIDEFGNPTAEQEVAQKTAAVFGAVART